MAMKCTSCGLPLEPGSTFCQNCGTAVTTAAPAPAFATASQAAPSGVMSWVERAVYFRVARVFSWVLLVAAIAGFLYSVVLAIGSMGDFLGGEQSVSKEEVKAFIASVRASNEAQQGKAGVAEESDPKLIGEYETELAKFVLLFPQELRQKQGGDDRVREELKGIFQEMASGKKNQIAAVREAYDLVSQFPEKERFDEEVGVFNTFIQLKLMKAQEAAAKKLEAQGKFAYLGGATLATAMLITLVSMVLVLLTIERNTRTK